MSETSLNKKIRNGQVDQFNYLLIIGEQEVESQCVNVRSRDNGVIGDKTIDEFINLMIEEYPEGVPIP